MNGRAVSRHPTHVPNRCDTAVLEFPGVCRPMGIFPLQNEVSILELAPSRESSPFSLPLKYPFYEVDRPSVVSLSPLDGVLFPSPVRGNALSAQGCIRTGWDPSQRLRAWPQSHALFASPARFDRFTFLMAVVTGNLVLLKFFVPLGKNFLNEQFRHRPQNGELADTPFFSIKITGQCIVEIPTLIKQTIIMGDAP